MKVSAPLLFHARGVILDSAFDDIQLMPPGKHEIEPINVDTGKPIKLTVEVNATTAERLESARASYQAEADANTGDAPYIDFNHEDGAAAAWVKQIYWAGDDPQKGGVRAKIEWSNAGREAVEGKTFRRFSPSFSIGDDKTISGAPVNMGGLVNSAAFRTISAFFATQANPSNPHQITTMTEEEIAAMTAQNDELKKQVEALQKELDEANQAQAQTEVDSAASEGRIPADDEVKAKWVKTILTNPEARGLLASLPVSSAFTTTIKAKRGADADSDDQSPLAVQARYQAMAQGAAKDKFRQENAAVLLAASRLPQK